MQKQEVSQIEKGDPTHQDIERTNSGLGNTQSLEKKNSRFANSGFDILPIIRARLNERLSKPESDTMSTDDQSFFSGLPSWFGGHADKDKHVKKKSKQNDNEKGVAYSMRCNEIFCRSMDRRHSTDFIPFAFTKN